MDGQWIEHIPLASWRSSSAAFIVSDQALDAPADRDARQNGPLNLSDYTIVRTGVSPGLTEQAPLQLGNLKCVSFSREALASLLEEDGELHTAFDALFHLYRRGCEIELPTRALSRPEAAAEASSVEEMERLLFTHMLDDKSDANVQRDLRTLESAVEHLSMQWPLRMGRKLKSILNRITGRT